jgi:hypothetical protein
MPSFQEMFMETKGRPINYQGNTLIMVDHFPILGCRNIRLVFESCDSRWRQGVALDLDGDFYVNDRQISKKVVIWQDTASEVVEISITTEADSIAVKNVWDTGNGVIESWHNGAAMITEDIPDGRRYRCNDGIPDDDFDDIVFRLERIPVH